MIVDTGQFSALRSTICDVGREVIQMARETPIEDPATPDGEVQRMERLAEAVHSQLLIARNITAAQLQRPGHGRHAAATSLRLAVLGWRW